MAPLSEKDRAAIIAARRRKRFRIVRLFLLICAFGFLLKALAGEQIFDRVMVGFFVLVAMVIRETGGEMVEAVVWPRRRKKRS